jgi:hypothetical protein
MTFCCPQNAKASSAPSLTAAVTALVRILAAGIPDDALEGMRPIFPATVFLLRREAT